jgi:hypothetical protein
MDSRRFRVDTTHLRSVLSTLRSASSAKRSLWATWRSIEREGTGVA